MKHKIYLVFLLLCSSFSSAQTVNGQSTNFSSDPLEPINRVVWDFNYQVLDAYIYRPVTQTYVDYVPGEGRKAINNFVLNFEEPSSMVNHLLQLQFKDSGNAFFRFAVNSTFGIVGFLDVAEKLGFKRRSETFSDLLGNWSVPDGPYLMVPVLGPRTTRNLMGGVVDGLYFPGSYLTYWQTLVLWGLDGLDIRESFLGQEQLLEQSLDPYTFVKETYLQYETFKIEGSNGDFEQLQQQIPEQQFESDLDDFMDELDE